VREIAALRMIPSMAATMMISSSDTPASARSFRARELDSRSLLNEISFVDGCVFTRITRIQNRTLRVQIRKRKFSIP